ncbi:MAG: sugar-transfer associated ATP-grasp domain-containing protein [Gemmataceae bacterium]
MYWLFTAARRLRQLGVLGMNRRNAACILDHNPRASFPVVDDKMRLHRLCGEIGVPTPEVYAEVTSYSMLRRLGDLLAQRGDFVLKPNRGSAGRGVLVVAGRDAAGFRRHNGELIRLEELRQHVSDILSGMYSLGGQPDSAIVQQRVRLHPAFAAITYKGIPDVRVILYRDQPAMAMLRLPTKQSNGRANLHQGGIGAGVELETGLTHARCSATAPSSGTRTPAGPSSACACRSGTRCWTMSRRVSEAVGLGYLGVDIVVDAVCVPMLLEANARPGLAIQIANGRGLVPGKLEAIDERLDRRPATISTSRCAEAGDGASAAEPPDELGDQGTAPLTPGEKRVTSGGTATRSRSSPPS